MRLTLRTLLAYLDNTLDPQDAQALRDKLSESGFATQLVQRIRSTLENGSLPAPSPEAVGPVEEANVISEYLDSTLPHEQVAEIERACLESDPHLAEAAACHQILTMILGKPAEVSPELRERIYDLPDRKIEDIAVAGSFSAVAIPVEEPQLKPLTGDLPTSELTPPRDGEPVQPVGVTDSGVSDAPTRLREAEESNAGTDLTSTLIAGSKPRSENDGNVFIGAGRPSRVAPWLVSLALAGVLLFALSRIFQPLLNPRTASVESSMGAAGMTAGEIEVPPEEAPVMVDVEKADSTEEESNAKTLPPPTADRTDVKPDGDKAASDVSRQSQDPTSESESPSESQKPSVATTDAGMPTTRTADAETPSNDLAAVDSTADSSPPAVPAAPPGPEKSADADPPPASAVVEPPNHEIAKITGPESLLAGLAGEQWVRLSKDAMVGEGLTISCAPTFRGQMTMEDVIITIVGPSQVQWLVGEDDAVTLRVDFGRILASATKAGASLNVQLGDETVKLGFGDVETVAAASIKHFRAPGFDPLLPENRIPLAGILSVQGTLNVAYKGQDETLETGRQWVKRGSADIKVSPVESVPSWIDPPDPATSNLESSARSGLLEFLKGGQPLEIALREASLFRRTEVSALAGQTLLHLGRGDVYFGGDGILSEPKQRAYWPDHYMTLLATVDRSVDSAQKLRDSIDSMDSANVQPLFRLLTGYSQKQLVEGGDEELVQLLDSSSMAVRVLALENLHRITGTTLYFRAEQENAVRRAPVIKKWVARLRKGDIRWQE